MQSPTRRLACLAAALGLLASMPAQATPPVPRAHTSVAAPAAATTLAPPGDARLWRVSGAGEAGEGGEGPAFDPALAKTDPVVFLTALEMAAAHYHAGRAAYAAGNHAEGMEMFAHGISEVYVDLEPALQQNGVAPFKVLMENAVVAASENKPQADIDRAVDTVLAALKDAEKHAPASALTAGALRRQVFAEVMNRAAHNYMIASRGSSRDAYLDGYGYRVAAETRAPELIAELKSASPETVAKIETALAALKAGFASIERPSTGTVPPGDLLVAVSKALLSVSSS